MHNFWPRETGKLLGMYIADNGQSHVERACVAYTAMRTYSSGDKQSKHSL